MPFKNQKELKRAINETLIKGLQRWGDRVFDLSQQTEYCYVPTDTGFLKMSGNKVDLPKGFYIIYRAKYASVVEMGSPARPVIGTFEYRIRAHRVKAFRRKDGVFIPAHKRKAHKKILINKKVIGFRPKLSKFQRGEKIFRVISVEKERTGQWFANRALRDSLPSLPTDLNLELKLLEKV